MGASAAQQKAQADGASSGSGKELAPSLPPAPAVPNHSSRARSFSNSEFLGTTSDWGEKTQIGGTSQEWRRTANPGTGFNTREGDLVKVAAQAAAAVHPAGKTAPAGFRRKVSFSGFSSSAPLSPPQAELSPAAQRGAAVGRNPAIWVDELRPETPPAQPTPVYQSKPKPFHPHEPWMCSICSQRNIPPHDDRCPACTRPRGTEPKRSYATANELTQSVVDAVNGTPGVSIHMMQSSATAATKGLQRGKNRKSSGAADRKSSPQRHGLSPDSGYQDSFRDAVPLAAATAPPGKLGQGGKLTQAGRGVAGGKGRGGGWLGRDVAFGGAGPSGRGGGGMQHAASTGGLGLGLTSDWDALDREMDFKEDAADYQDLPGAAAHRSGSMTTLLGGPPGGRVQWQGGAAATASGDRGLQGGGSGRPQPPHMPPEPLLLPNPGADRLPHISRSASTPSRGRTPPGPGPPMAGGTGMMPPLSTQHFPGATTPQRQPEWPDFGGDGRFAARGTTPAAYAAATANAASVSVASSSDPRFTTGAKLAASMSQAPQGPRGWPDLEVHSLSPGSHSPAAAASAFAPPRGSNGGQAAPRGAGSSYGPATAGPRPTTPLQKASPPQSKAAPEVAKASVAAARRSEAASSRAPPAASAAASGGSAADVDVEALLKASAGRKAFQGKSSTPSRAPATADMDVEALLQAQKARIEGLKTKLNRQLG